MIFFHKESKWGGGGGGGIWGRGNFFLGGGGGGVDGETVEQAQTNLPLQSWEQCINVQVMS